MQYCTMLYDIVRYCYNTLPAPLGNAFSQVYNIAYNTLKCSFPMSWLLSRVLFCVWNYVKIEKLRVSIATSRGSY